MNKKIILLVIALAVVIGVAILAQREPESGGQTLQTQLTESTHTEPSVEATEQTVESTPPQEQTEGTEPTETTESQPPVTLPQRAQADYEHWLGAAMVIGISLEYPDFQLDGIYAASSTELEGGGESLGTVILFTSGGESLAIHSTPLDAERTESGSRDLSAEGLGFATFDPVESVDVSGMTEIDLESLGELIEQSLLVSVYTH